MLTVDYSFPITYPDFNIGALTYITRLRANLFYDFAGNTNRYNPTFNIYSYGADILFDAHWLRMPYPITLGLRLYKTNLNSDFGIRLIGAISF
jgi:hypothetical protein